MHRQISCRQHKTMYVLIFKKLWQMGSMVAKMLPPNLAMTMMLSMTWLTCGWVSPIMQMAVVTATSKPRNKGLIHELGTQSRQQVRKGQSTKSEQLLPKKKRRESILEAISCGEQIKFQSKRWTVESWLREFRLLSLLKSQAVGEKLRAQKTQQRLNVCDLSLEV